MAVHDDALFDLTPSDVTVTGNTSTLTTDGYVFDDAVIETFAILNTGGKYANDGGWSFLAGTDVGTVSVPINVSPADFNTSYGNTFFTINMGESHVADNSDPPDTFLAGVDLGTYPVDEGELYYLDLPIIPYEGTTAPSSALKMVFLDNTDTVISTVVQQYSDSGFPGSYANYLYHTDAIPTGVTKVRLEIWAIPQPYVEIAAGAGFGIVKAFFFKRTASDYYDDPQNVGYYGNDFSHTYGRHLETVHGREVIIGQTERLSVPDVTEVTIVAAWVSTPGNMLNWNAYWSAYPGINGYNGIMNPSFAGDPVGVAILDNVVAMAMTFTTDHVASFYDLTGAMILTEDWEAESTPPFVQGEMQMAPAEGLLRMSVWDRVLDDDEIAEALATVSGLTVRTISWSQPFFDGESPVTGFVVSVLKGGVVTEYPIADPTVVTFVVPAGASAVQVAAVNAVGRSTPTEIVF